MCTYVQLRCVCRTRTPYQQGRGGVFEARGEMSDGGPQASDVSYIMSQAIFHNNTTLLEELLVNGADPNFPNTYGDCPLHEAAQYGQRECVSLLLTHKAGVNAIGTCGKTPLHKAVGGVNVQVRAGGEDAESAVHENQLDIVRLLVSHGADLNIIDDAGLTPRDLAMQCDFYKCADLLDELKEIMKREAEERLKQSRLQGVFSACKSGDLEGLKNLLPYVPEAINEIMDENGDNLLMCAARCGHVHIVEHLLDEGAVAMASPVTNMTALHIAAHSGHGNVVVCLLNKLPALLMIDDSPKETTLHIAARLGHIEIVKNLLTVAVCSERLKNRSISTSEEESNEVEKSYLCGENLRVPMNDTLPEMFIDIMAVTVNEQKTALHEAAITGNVEIVKLLVEFMRDHLSQDNLTSNVSHPTDSRNGPVVGGFSPLQLEGTPSSPARWSSGLASRNLPSTRKAYAVPGIDLMTLKGRTAFHEAAKQGHFEVMEVLLQAGADINAYMRPSLDAGVNVELTALVQACLMQRLDVVRFLLQHGATDARLKALSRSLKIPYNDAAGLLLCYNNGLNEIVDVRRPTPEMIGSQPLANIHVSWNSKNLSYICKDWLELAINEFPNAKDKFCAISELDVSSNNLTSLPIEIFTLPYLKQLDFNRNKVTQFPIDSDESFGGWSCPRLYTIDASNNQLAALPTCLFHLPELKELMVNSNRISEVPLCVWTAPKLQRLYLSKNCLENFPSNQDEFPGISVSFQMSISESSPMSPYGVTTSPPSQSNSDSGYLSHPAGDLVESMNVKYNSPKFAFPILKAGSTLNSHKSLEVKSHTIQTQSVVSRRLENFQDDNVEVEELEDSESTAEYTNKKSFMLETLDISHNQLTSLPSGLSCLAPRLTKLNISHNRIKCLGTISDFPFELEYLEASSNELHTAIAPALPSTDARYYQPCARKVVEFASNGLTQPTCNETPKSYFYKPCNHRSHKNLRKLSTMKFNKNHLVDLQLFRLPTRSKLEFGGSMEESMRTKRTNTCTFGQEMANSNVLPRLNEVSGKSSVVVDKRSQTLGRKLEPVNRRNGSDPSPSFLIDQKPSKESLPDSLDSSNSSQEEQSPTPPLVVTPLYPQLTTLEITCNRLKTVPAHIHLITNLSTLSISHNTEIDTLPLEIGNLEHLWSLEYEGCPLTNPPYQDLDKFRLASDKLLYMRSLLHDAKQNDSMKLMLVGFQKMGKTTILSRLCECHERVTPSTTFLQRVTGEEPPLPPRSKGKRPAPLSTVGVDLGIWKYRKDLEPEYLKQKKKGAKQLRSVTFYTWDFGGQEEYYVTHQCFLSSRSLYLAVWNITHGERGIEELGPWLHNIQGRAPGSPVVIVGTHCDKLKPEEREARKKELNDIITHRYLVGRGPQQLREMGLPKIVGVYYVSCPTSGHTEGITKLRIGLYDIAFSLNAPGKAGLGVSKTKLLEQPIPACYLKLQEKVREMAVQCRNDNNPPVIKETMFRDFTKEIIANPRELNQAVTFLHENGIMLHYDTPALSHLYFVDPQWLCDMLAHIVTVPEVNRFIQRTEGPEAGILRTSILSHVFKGSIFPQAHRNEYIELLSKFEVALYLDRHRLLVPSMLPASPCYTLHSFNNVFPRPTLKQILASSPETSRLFGALSSSKVDPNTKPSQLAVATHVSEELFRTGLILRRFYFMTYVPSGFWPRLISRFLASTGFTKVILQSLGYREDEIKEISEQIISGQLGGAVSLEWSYWKTGIELWYKGLSLIRLTEVMPNGNFKDCKSSPSIFEQSSSTPIEPAFDTQDLSFELGGGWMPVEMTPSRGVEIIVPDTVCLAALQKDIQVMLSVSPSQFMASPELKGEDSASIYPSYESHWMSAEILSMAVDFIDTLLEDWYPGLGVRDGNKNSESIPYVNRVVPCPFCVSGATPLSTDMNDELCELPSPSPVETKEPNRKRHLIRIKLKRHKPRDNMEETSQQQQPPSPLPSDQPKAKRALFTSGGGSEDSVTTSHASSTSSCKGAANVTVNGYEASCPLSPLEVNSVSTNSLPLVDVGDETSLKIDRKESLAQVFQDKLGGEANEFEAEGEIMGSPLRSAEVMTRENFSEMSLTQASKFGFMIETCILAARNDECLVCPAHKDYPLTIRDITPDIIFADLPSGYILDPRCVDKGKYVTEGAFGQIYHGAVYPTPTSTDDEGREVAIKIDRMDSKFSASPDSATKAYMEVRAEVSNLSRLNHPHVIGFVGVVLHPLCFILEWAPGSSLKSVIEKYRKVDARISPMALQNTAYQVASGLAYLHEHKIVYYDLKSPNILVFKFPLAQDSLQATQTSVHVPPQSGGPASQRQCSVHVKIADLGISQAMTPGGVMGFKGSPGFMAPEILKYVGMEACTEKVDIFSYAMFLYEMISMYFPFEKQNLMKAQIEKLVTEEERPSLQSRELNNPILFLDVMRWCWQQDFRNRPSAVQLTEILTNPSISRLVDALNLHNSTDVTCACICTLPIEVLPPTDEGGSLLPPTSPHLHVTRGDLQEELWLSTYSEKSAEIVVINFKDKVAQSFPVENSKITSMCCVINYMWLGTEEGKLLILDAVNKTTLIDRQLTATPGQGIVAMYYLLVMRQVVVIRRDGCVLIFNDTIQERMITDNNQFDNKVNSTLLPVRASFKTPEKLPVLCSVLVAMGDENKATLWCGTRNEMLLLIDIYPFQVTYCRKLYNRSRYDTSPEYCVTAIAKCEVDESATYVWAITQPNNVLVCWDARKETLLNKVNIEQFTTEPVTSLHAMGSQLQLALKAGKILLLNTSNVEVTETVILHGHGKAIHQMLSIGGRIFPRHWLPSIIGRSNTIDFYKDLIDETDAKSIRDSMFGHQTRLLVTIGHGYHGLADRIVEPLMSPRDRQENFVLLWAIDSNS